MTNMSATTKSDLEVLKFYQERGTSEARKSVEDKNEWTILWGGETTEESLDGNAQRPRSYEYKLVAEDPAIYENAI